MQVTLVNIIATLFIYIILTISFTLPYHPTQFFNLTHALFITNGAYLTYLFAQQLHWPLFYAIPLAIGGTITLATLLDRTIFRFMRHRSAAPLAMMLASLGLYTILQNTISLIWGDDTKSIRTGEVTVGHEIWGAYITNIQLITIATSLTLFVLTLLFFRYTRLGKAIRAVSSNPELCNLLGIDSDQVILWATAIGSGMAAIAGILVAFDTDMTPTMGFNLLLYGVVAMIIGGVGSTWGLLGGCFLLATAQHLGAYYWDSKWMDAITFTILIAFLIWRPLGFSGKKLRKVEI